MSIHSFGWHPSKPDFRDFIYQVPPTMQQALPPKVDLRPILPVPCLDQGSLGSCGPCALASDILFDEYKNNQVSKTMPSRLYSYYNTRAIEGTVNSDAGVGNRDLIRAAVDYGWCDESLWPYDITQFRRKPSAGCYVQGSSRRIEKFFSVPQDLNTMKARLAGGDPFISGFTVYSSFESNQVAQSGMVPMPTGTEQVLGGHDVLFMGYDDAIQRFLFRNSWGLWGLNGYGWMPYQYALNPNLSSDFWTVQYGDAPPPPPDPPPPPQPSPTPQPGEPAAVAVMDALGNVIYKGALSSVK
jgi:C1A family cysteine protease